MPLVKIDGICALLQRFFTQKTGVKSGLRGQRSDHAFVYFDMSAKTLLNAIRLWRVLSGTQHNVGGFMVL